MSTAAISSIPRTGVSGTRKPCWKDRSIPSAPFAALKRRTQFLRTDRDTRTDSRLSAHGTFRTCQDSLTMSAHRGILLQNSWGSIAGLRLSSGGSLVALPVVASTDAIDV